MRMKRPLPWGKVKGVTFNKETGGFRCPTPGGYERQHKRLIGVGTWQHPITIALSETATSWSRLGHFSKIIPTWGTEQYAA